MSEGSDMHPERPHLIANDVDLVLHLRNPLTHNGKQLRDGGARIHQDLQTGGVIGVKEGKGCRGNTIGKVSNTIKKRLWSILLLQEETAPRTDP